MERNMRKIETFAKKMKRKIHAIELLKNHLMYKRILHKSKQRNWLQFGMHCTQLK